MKNPNHFKHILDQVRSLISKEKEKIVTSHEDPWSQAKYDRGGDEEYLRFLATYKPVQELLAKADTPIEPVKKNPIQNSAVNNTVPKQPEDIAGTVVKQIPENTSPLPPEFKDLDLIKLYRSYKNTPHRPESLLLKYMVHRIENVDKYNDPNKAQKLDSDFIQLHQKGKAAEKNGHVNISHLHNGIKNNYQVMNHLIDHQKSLHNVIKQNYPEHIHMINGEPHIGLSRGLDVHRDSRGKEHALASYAHDHSTGFGSVQHHQYVPLKNVWYSYDFGLKDASSSQFGPEDEWLVSPHDIKYSEDKKTTKEFPRHVYSHDSIEHALSNGKEIPLEAQHQLSSGNNSKLHKVMAKNKYLHPEIQKKLASDYEYGSEVHRSLARNENVDPDVLKYIYDQNGHNYEFNDIITQNPQFHKIVDKLTPSQIEKIVDINPRNLAENHNLHQFVNKLSPEQFVHLIKQEPYRLIKNPNLDQFINKISPIRLNAIVKSVPEALAENPNLYKFIDKFSPEQLNDIVRKGVYQLSKNPNLNQFIDKLSPEQIQALKLYQVNGHLLNKSEPLQKGSFQARNKFNPQSPKYNTVQDLLADWTGDYHDSSVREEVGKLADSMDLTASKNRIFHKLSKMTHSRVSPAGEREFLLHRGVSPDEHEVKYHDGNHHSDHYSSWTPHYHVAEKFAKDGVIGRPDHPTTIHSAWIPESKVSLMPNMYINAHPYKDENEVILKPGIYKAKANKGNV